MIRAYQKASHTMKTKPSKDHTINAVTFSLCYLVIFLILYPLFLRFLLLQGNPRQILLERRANQIKDGAIPVKDHRTKIEEGGIHGVYLSCQRKSDQVTYDYIDDKVKQCNECAEDEIFVTSALLSDWRDSNGTNEALATRFENENFSDSTLVPEDPNLINESMPSRHELSFFYVQ